MPKRLKCYGSTYKVFKLQLKQVEGSIFFLCIEINDEHSLYLIWKGAFPEVSGCMNLKKFWKQAPRSSFFLYSLVAFPLHLLTSRGTLSITMPLLFLSIFLHILYIWRKSFHGLVSGRKFWKLCLQILSLLLLYWFMPTTLASTLLCLEMCLGNFVCGPRQKIFGKNLTNSVIKCQGRSTVTKWTLNPLHPWFPIFFLLFPLSHDTIKAIPPPSSNLTDT